MTLKRYLTTLACSAALALPVALFTAAPASAQVPPGVFSRPLHFVYARTAGKAFQGNSDPALNHTDAQLLTALDQVPGGVTALVPFMLNVTNVAQYDTFIRAITETRGIIIVPGVGGDPDTGERIDSAGYKAMAANAKPYTDYIRLENMQGYLDRGTGGQAAIQSMINYVIGLGYKHVMLNPWPVDMNNQPIPFTNVELDSTIYQVKLKKVNTPQGYCPDHTADATNWGLPNNNTIVNMMNYRRVKVLINYESAPQHEALTCLEREDPLSSRAAMNITATAIENYTAYDLHWTPPFTTAYDPLKWGTWTWEANRLGDF